MIKGMRKVGVAKEPQMENISMINKYAYQRQQFKKMIEEEKATIKASDLVGSGHTPQKSIKGYKEFGDELFYNSSFMSRFVDEKVAENIKNVKNIPNLIVEASKALSEKQTIVEGELTL